jgi:uncharacterized membrane protein
LLPVERIRAPTPPEPIDPDKELTFAARRYHGSNERALPFPRYGSGQTPGSPAWLIAPDESPSTEVCMYAALARLRNRTVTGFLFIMPVLITLAILGKFWKHLLKVGSTLSRLLSVDTALGPSGDAVAAVLFFLLVCIVAGFLTRISFLRNISEQIDLHLNRLIPGYSQVRTEATKKIRVGKSDEPLFDACLVKVEEVWQPGYIIESNADGTQTVFVPQAPTLIVGQVYVVEPGRVRKLGVDSTALNAYLKRLGKGIMSPTGPSSARAV